MARVKISKLAADLNISVQTAVEFLGKKNISVDTNPNTRIDEEVAKLLLDAFEPDPNKLNRPVSPLPKVEKEKPETKPEEPKEISLAEQINKPKIVGQIKLDSKGMPVAESKPAAAAPEKPAEKEQPAPAPVPEVKAEQPTEPKAETKAAEAETKPSKPEPKVEPQPAPTPVAKEEPEAPQAPAVSAHPTEEKIIAKENPVKPKNIEHTGSPMTEKTETKPAEQPAASAAPAKPQQAADDKKSEEIFSLERPKDRPTINVVGKIDLAAINQSTRPKKKSKEDRRRDNSQKNAGNGQANAGQSAANGSANGEKRRRRRIGKEKIDIEKQADSAANNSGSNRNGGGSRQQDNNRGKGANANSKSKRQQHVEVNEEDVQKQVKETLARLTSKDKGQKKSAKWRKEKREAFASREREAAEMASEESRTLKLTEFVTANDLASMMNIPINQVIATCMNLGVMVSINQRLDAETINIVAEEFGYKTEYVSAEVVDAIHQEEDKEEELIARPPIVTVMGHVDHGKTSLLDYIRNANVIAGEAGGITQHIGAYNVKLQDGRHITFLDTPGHEAFTAMRARGAKVTDLVIIIVAADDNVMPQTIEAINHASAAGVPMVFAINKIDKPAANPDKIKEELAGMNYLVEEWGGKYQSQDISAKKGIGVEELMEKVLLEAEMLDLKANPDRKAVGSIIESSLDKGRGYVATVLVQNGTLRVGDVILAGTHFGKIKAMFNERNQRIKEAGPAEPALILGLNGAPTAGDTFNVMDTEQEAREIANKRQQLQRELGLRTKKILTLEDIGRRRAIGNFQELNIIVKGDVDGSIEALSDSLIKLSTDEIQVNIIHKAVGEISESDVTLAAASDAIIIGFQVRPSLAARREAEREGVEIRLYSVIYQAIEEVKDAMAGMLAPEIKEEITGTAEVMETYHISKVGTIAGALVRDGKLKRGNRVRLIRDGIVRYTGELGSLKRFKDDVKEVTSGYDCGISIQGYNDIKVGDIIEGFTEVEVARDL